MVSSKTGGKTTATRQKKSLQRLLELTGKMTPDLAVQLDLLAKLTLITDRISVEILKPDFEHVIRVRNRDGNERQEIHPLDSLFLKYAAQTQLALRAAGMNRDTKPSKGNCQPDGFDVLMSKLRDIDDE